MKKIIYMDKNGFTSKELNRVIKENYLPSTWETIKDFIDTKTGLKSATYSLTTDNYDYEITYHIQKDSIYIELESVK